MTHPDLLTTIGIFAFAALSSGGFLAALLYPRTAQARLFESRFNTIAAAKAQPASQNRGTDDVRRKRSVEETLRELEEKQKKAGRKGARPTLVGRMRQAQLNWTKKTYYGLSVVAGLCSFALAFLLGANLLAAAGFGLTGGLLLPHSYVGFKRGRRLKRFASEFPNALDVIVRGIRSGLPLADCMKIIATEAPQPVRGEFKALVDDQMLGVPLDEAVQRLADRVPLSETSFFSIVIGIQSRTGGSLSEALGNLAKVLRERKKMRAKIKAMSAEAKTSGGIIGALPIIVAGLVYVTSPDYISLLATEAIGNVVLGASAVWMLIGILVMKKMISFDF